MGGVKLSTENINKLTLSKYIIILFGLFIIFIALFSDKIDFISWINMPSTSASAIPAQIINNSVTPTQTSTPSPTQSSSNTPPSTVTIDNIKYLLSLINPSFISLFIIAMKLLVGFWIFIIVVSIVRWYRVSEQGTKIFGVEINQKYNQEDFGNAAEGLYNVRKQLAVLDDLNDRINDYLMKFSKNEFLSDCLDLPEVIHEKIRSTIENILRATYQEIFPEVRIYVVFEKYINELPPKIYSVVKMRVDQKDMDDFIKLENLYLGLGILRGVPGLETVIVIDSSKAGYETSFAEIATASNIFYSITNSIVN